MYASFSNVAIESNIHAPELRDVSRSLEAQICSGSERKKCIVHVLYRMK